MKKSNLMKVVAVCLLSVTLMAGILYADSISINKTGGEAAVVQKGGVLGDLSPFKKIAEDTLEIVKRGKMAEAKNRIKDLETAWDDAEETMKPKSPEKWQSVDKSIDRALAKLRTAEPEPAACATALKVLIAKFTVMNK